MLIKASRSTCVPVKNHSSFVSTDVPCAAALTVPHLVITLSTEWATLCSLPITIPLLLERNRSIRLQDVRFARGTQIRCQPSVVRNHHPASSLHLPFLHPRGADLKCVHVTANIWTNKQSWSGVFGFLWRMWVNIVLCLF